jgi:hypothetical protein
VVSLIKAFPVAGKQKAIDICRAFTDGAPKNATGSVFYGVNKSNINEWARYPRHPQFYIDNSYFDAARGQQYRVTKGRIQCEPAGRASTGERFARLGITLKPWRPNIDGHYLVVEQSPSFMTTVARDPKWLERTVKRLTDEGVNVRVRPWDRDKAKMQATLVADLEGASTLVTHSSAAAVTAVIEGIPVIVSDMSALAHMRWSTDPEHDQRLGYLNVLADNQWTLDEIRAGKAWEWLN